MRFSDLLSMSVNNLWRRKLRTFLTVLGVLIGTASIVVMVSLGIGFNQLIIEQIASYGSIREIHVNSDNMAVQVNGSKKEPDYMTDKVIAKFGKMNHVTIASPMLETNVLMFQGVYQADINIVGVTPEYMKKITLEEGHLPDSNKQGIEMIVGDMVDSRFENPKSRSYKYNDDDSSCAPDIDFLNKPMFVVFDTESYYQTQNGGTTDNGTKDNGTKIKPPKKYLLPTVGMIKGNEEGGSSNSYNVYVNLDALKKQLKQVFKKNPIPSQPTNKLNKPYNYFIYNQAVVEVDDMKNVTTVQKVITDMGYQAYSSAEWLESSQKQSKMIQALLGGIGAVALFVAAIGIANTMMMSIYERTKEIGILKVLGCDMNNIKNMFLIESGFIGFLGGISGILFSYGVSLLINKFLGGHFMTDMPGKLSRTPFWLSLAAVGFAVFVGMAAGFFPALRAMKLSPLAAIRNE